MASHQDCHLPNGQHRHFIVVTAAFQSENLLFMTVNIASEMHSNALRSLTQPCLTAYCIQCNAPVVQAFTKLCMSVHPWESVIGTKASRISQTLVSLLTEQQGC